ncbi:hypothetical protein [Synechococcus phage Ssp-JY39]
MRSDLLSEIENFMVSENIGEHRFGILAANNGRLVERLRAGGRIWPETEQQVRDFMTARRAPKEAAE